MARKWWTLTALGAYLPDPDAARPDWLGFASFSAALASLVYALISPPSPPSP
jgi:hypothetical protein